MANKSSSSPSPSKRHRRTVSPEILAERRGVIDALRPVVQLLGTVIGSNVEVALHDLTHPESSVIAIRNGHVTGRATGSSALHGPKGDLSYAAVMEARSASGAGHSLIADYPTENASGQLLRSSTIIFRDADGHPFAALCINADMAMFEMAHTWLATLLNKKPVEETVATAEPQLDVLMKEIIDDSVRTLGKPVSLMNKEEKIYAVQTMTRRGLFIVKGGVQRAAAALSVSRHSVYNYLDELRRRDEAAR